MSYDSPQIPMDFDELADWLLSINSQFPPSELHGALVGGLCGTMRLAKTQWAQFGMAVAGASTVAPSADQVLGGLAEEQLQLLSGDELGFQLFLPDDDEAIEARTEQLAHWCRGFLGGFAEAQARLDQVADRFPETVEESLRDIAAIGQASAEASEDDEGGVLQAAGFFDEDGWSDEAAEGVAEGADYSSGADDAERDFVEIVEYLRLATLTVFTEVGWVERLAPAASKKNTLH